MTDVKTTNPNTRVDNGTVTVVNKSGKTISQTTYSGGKRTSGSAPISSVAAGASQSTQDFYEAEKQYTETKFKDNREMTKAGMEVIIKKLNAQETYNREHNLGTMSPEAREQYIKNEMDRYGTTQSAGAMFQESRKPLVMPDPNKEPEKVAKPITPEEQRLYKADPYMFYATKYQTLEAYNKEMEAKGYNVHAYKSPDNYTKYSYKPTEKSEQYEYENYMFNLGKEKRAEVPLLYETTTFLRKPIESIGSAAEGERAYNIAVGRNVAESQQLHNEGLIGFGKYAGSSPFVSTLAMFTGFKAIGAVAGSLELAKATGTAAKFGTVAIEAATASKLVGLGSKAGKGLMIAGTAGIAYDLTNMAMDKNMKWYNYADYGVGLALNIYGGVKGYKSGYASYTPDITKAYTNRPSDVYEFSRANIVNKIIIKDVVINNKRVGSAGAGRGYVQVEGIRGNDVSYTAKADVSLQGLAGKTNPSGVTNVMSTAKGRGTIDMYQEVPIRPEMSGKVYEFKRTDTYGDLVLTNIKEVNNVRGYTVTAGRTSPVKIGSRELVFNTRNIGTSTKLNNNVNINEGNVFGKVASIEGENVAVKKIKLLDTEFVESDVTVFKLGKKSVIKGQGVIAEKGKGATGYEYLTEITKSNKPIRANKSKTTPAIKKGFKVEIVNGKPLPADYFTEPFRSNKINTNPTPVTSTAEPSSSRAGVGTMTENKPTISEDTFNLRNLNQGIIKGITDVQRTMTIEESDFSFDTGIKGAYGTLTRGTTKNEEGNTDTIIGVRTGIGTDIMSNVKQQQASNIKQKLKQRQQQTEEVKTKQVQDITQRVTTRTQTKMPKTNNPRVPIITMPSLKGASPNFRPFKLQSLSKSTTNKKYNKGWIIPKPDILAANLSITKTGKPIKVTISQKTSKGFASALGKAPFGWSFNTNKRGKR